MVRYAIYVLGVLALISGLIWAAQGSGYFPYPASSFMINQSAWIYRGLVVAAVGIAAILVAHYSGRRS
jgi:hypothetical protein